MQQHFLTPLVNRLEDMGITAVCLIPTGRLSLLPLHAAAIDTDIVFNYAPSARVLAAGYEALAEVTTPSLMAVVDPPHQGAHRLPFTSLETAVIQELFPAEDAHVLSGATASLYNTKAALDARNETKSTAYLHFACHGHFNPVSPLESGLALAGNDRLTLTNLLDEIKLRGTRLAVLSACQTAITDFRQVPDEAIGLPAGFLQAGVPGVVGTLWSVNDISTALLIQHFYQYHLIEEMSPAAALRQAQLWLRDMTLAAFKQYNETIRGKFPLFYAQLEQIRRGLLAKFGGDEAKRPFSHPYYWAAFTMTGV